MASDYSREASVSPDPFSAGRTQPADASATAARKGADPFAVGRSTGAPADPFAAGRSPAASVVGQPASPPVLIEAPAAADGRRARAGTRTSHWVVLFWVLGAALASGWCVYAALASLHVVQAQQSLTMASGWLTGLVLAWGACLIGAVWSLVVLIRPRGSRLLPGIAFALAVLLPAFAAFTGAKFGAEIAAAQISGDVMQLAETSGPATQTLAWLLSLVS